jgi:hypothetical protein
MGLYDSYIKDDFWKHLMYVNYMSWENLEEAYKKYNYQANPEAMVSVNSVAAYFNGVGVLISQGLIDIELVDELLSSIIILQWEKLEPIIIDMRLKTNSPQLHTNFETLYKEIKKKHTQ